VAGTLVDTEARRMVTVTKYQEEVVVLIILVRPRRSLHITEPATSQSPNFNKENTSEE